MAIRPSSFFAWSSPPRTMPAVERGTLCTSTRFVAARGGRSVLAWPKASLPFQPLDVEAPCWSHAEDIPAHR